jgi:glucokinase
MTEIAVLDIGGTNARLALAAIEGGRVVSLGDPTILPTGQQPSLPALWRDWTASLDRPAPRGLAIAWAGPVDATHLQLTNSPLAAERSSLAAALGLERVHIVNDFAAVAWAVDALGPEHFRHICGPGQPLPAQGPVSIVGPGTGLGAAILLRGEAPQVIATEAGHIGFSPADAAEEDLHARLRSEHGRVSVERVSSGPGLAAIHQAATGERRDDIELWEAALMGDDLPALGALARYCRILGAAAGDIALAQGAEAVVIAGGVGLRLADTLAASAFPAGFTAKGRFAARMETLPVKLLTHPQAGLYGAAAAFARAYPD